MLSGRPVWLSAGGGLTLFVAVGQALEPAGTGNDREGGGPMPVVLADDSLLLREGLARLLAEAGFEVVGQAATGEELLDQVEATRPDVAIVRHPDAAHPH